MQSRGRRRAGTRSKIVLGEDRNSDCRRTQITEDGGCGRLVVAETGGGRRLMVAVVGVDGGSFGRVLRMVSLSRVTVEGFIS